MLIRHPRDAEEAATRWMRYWGWTDARTTPAGADEGIDVVATLAVAQVKAYMSPVGRPDVQNLFGVASAEKKSALFFALTDYTAEAKAWANKAGVGLFRFDLQGEPEPVNHAARQLISEQQARLDGAETTRRDEHPSV
jgi:predicted helicase